MDKEQRAQMAQMAQRIEETTEAVQALDHMLHEAMKAVLGLVETVKELKEAQDHHRQTQLDEINKNHRAHQNAASERSSLASAIERARHGFDVPDAREIRSKMENVRTSVTMNTASIAEVRNELAAMDNAQMSAARQEREELLEATRTADAAIKRLEELEDRVEKVEALATPVPVYPGNYPWGAPSDAIPNTVDVTRETGQWETGRSIWIAPSLPHGSCDPAAWTNTSAGVSFYGDGTEYTATDTVNSGKEFQAKPIEPDGLRGIGGVVELPPLATI